jgi:hypothetical protein
MVGLFLGKEPFLDLNVKGMLQLVLLTDQNIKGCRQDKLVRVMMRRLMHLMKEVIGLGGVV